MQSAKIQIIDPGNPDKPGWGTSVLTDMEMGAMREKIATKHDMPSIFCVFSNSLLTLTETPSSSVV